MSVKNRLKDFIKSQNLTVSAFEKSINVSNGYVNSISKGIGGEDFMTILEKSPNLNINWLLTGKDEMLKSEKQVVHFKTIEAVSKDLDSEIEVFTNKNGIKFFEYPDGSTKIEVIKYPFSAYATIVESFSDEYKNAEFGKTTFSVDKVAKGNYVAFTTKGESMNGGGIDDSPSGTDVLVRELGRQLWTSLHKSKYGFIIITTDGIYHKDLIYNTENGMYTLNSRNPKFKSSEVSINDVIKIYTVIKRTF
ncbi:hypothetical protein [Flavobacterium columnare]|uniref:hypothetical protein n=1 Tax=Flavobacterium columnare TaxID=996 RepID=UPI001BC887BD|nr:hypothetical protein [Flavobacterium columnare]AUX17383.1 hypothetical protein AQ623_03040 [Flavobacterium columnare]